MIQAVPGILKRAAVPELNDAQIRGGGAPLRGGGAELR